MGEFMESGLVLQCGRTIWGQPGDIWVIIDECGKRNIEYSCLAITNRLKASPNLGYMVEWIDIKSWWFITDYSPHGKQLRPKWRLPAECVPEDDPMDYQVVCPERIRGSMAAWIELPDLNKLKVNWGYLWG